LDRSYLCLSPGLAESETLTVSRHHAEGKSFHARLKCLGKEVGASVVMGVDRGFDKKPASVKKNPKRNTMYAEAARDLIKIRCEH
jgi:hypothetical protein